MIFLFLLLNAKQRDTLENLNLIFFIHNVSPNNDMSPIQRMNIHLKIYDIPMKFARKLIHGGPVHLCFAIDLCK